MNIFTGKISQAGSGTIIPGRIYITITPPSNTYGSIKFRGFSLEKIIDFKLDIKKTVI